MISESFFKISKFSSRKSFYRKLTDLKKRYGVVKVLKTITEFDALKPVQMHKEGYYTPVGLERLTYLGMGFGKKPFFLFKSEMNGKTDIYKADEETLLYMHKAVRTQENERLIKVFYSLVTNAYEEYLEKFENEVSDD